MMLDKAGIKYTVIDAEDQKDLTQKYGVKKPPLCSSQTDRATIATKTRASLKNSLKTQNNL